MVHSKRRKDQVLNKVINPDEYTICRGIPVPREYITQKEYEYEAKLVPDSKPGLQEDLDRNLREFRAQAKALGKSPNPKGNRFESGTSWYFFAEIPVPTQLFGVNIVGFDFVETTNIHKPIWFERPKVYTRGMN